MLLTILPNSIYALIIAIFFKFQTNKHIIQPIAATLQEGRIGGNQYG
jgi:hypothetical protein